MPEICDDILLLPVGNYSLFYLEASCIRETALELQFSVPCLNDLSDRTFPSSHMRVLLCANEHINHIRTMICQKIPTIITSLPQSLSLNAHLCDTYPRLYKGKIPTNTI